ncbi:MAG TPA: hypothetical protein VFY02_08660 [Gaiellaceae bacterium]|nr:hypothetical protein [Gaiellaceae bacterium]
MRLCVVVLAGALAFLPTASADHDTSAPVVSFTLSGTSGTNGWFRSDVTIRWSVLEPEGLTSTTGCEIAKLVTTEGTTSHTCTATSHGGTASSTATLKLDKTLPSVPAGSAARPPDANGWYNRPVVVTFTATDAVSGIASCAGSSYGGPDSATASAHGSCTDLAGNTSSGTLSLQYDASPPSATAAASRAPDANGWYRAPLTISFAQAPGDVSGAGTCSSAVGYSGPDAATISRAGTCTDRAGNTSSPVALEFRYDSTPPAATAAASRAPDANGWYNHAVTVSFAQAPGDLSGPGSCSPAVTYSGPDAAAVSRAGSCTDRAGNTGSPASLALKYDATPPSASGSLARGPDRNGWYNHPVGLDVTGADVTSGVASCTSPTYAGPDGASRTVSGTCTDRAGNPSAPATATLKYDATPPGAAASASRAPDANGWYRAPLTISFAAAGSDVSGADTCSGPVTYSGPDDASASRAGTCTDNAGNTSGPAALAFKYDATPPTAVAAADRPPNANGWYRQPVTVSFAQAAGDLSGPGSCTAPASYSGPDAAAASRSGTCTDRAGNTSVPTALAFKYDATPPTASASLARAPDRNGWYNRPVGLTVTGSDATSGLASCSTPTYAGPDGAARAVSGTCTDLAGNVSPPAGASLDYDATAPTAVAAASRPPDSSGWYNHALAIAFSQAAGDASGPDTCTAPVTYSGPDDAEVSRSGACTDRAGNTSSPVTLAFKYDSTPPSATGALARPPDANGWYNHPVALGVTGSDATSGIASCAGPSYAGPDGPAQTIGGSCTDRAGNTNAAVAATLKYDATPPTASGSLARGPDANGWYNHAVSFALTGSDATSGVGNCGGGYAGPDGADRQAAGTCTDVAGNVSAPVRATIDYDATPPTATASFARPPDANGWYNRPVAVALTGSDATSGLATCAGATYDGPDGAARQVGGGCTDEAGNTGTAGATLDYDATPPTTTAVPDRGDGGWYREPVTVSFVGADPASGVAGCTAPADYAGPDTSGVALGGSCTDVAGNTSSAAFTVRYDTTSPSVSAGLARAPDGNGWYNRPVAVVASGADAASGLASCTTPGYGGPDSAGVVLTTTCRDNAGNSAAASVSLKYDATAPTVTASADRPPDGAGWYRRALTVSFAATDATSGIESCAAPVRYAGPDRANGLVGGTCRDHAGNTGEGVHAFRYDGTAPALGRLAVRMVKGAATLSWQRSRDAVSVQLTRTPGRNRARSSVVYRGRGTSFADRSVRAGVRYRYELRAADAAGNVARSTVSVRARPPLYRPAAGAVVRGRLTLGWEAVAGARFYNVQLLRGGRKILSAWPKQPTLRVPDGWTFGGERRRLEAGVYTWWVWAARGTRAQPRYGRPLGSSTFTVPRR